MVASLFPWETRLWSLSFMYTNSTGPLRTGVDLFFPLAFDPEFLGKIKGKGLIIVIHLAFLMIKMLNMLKR